MQHQLILFRHGQTDWNKAGRWQGHADIPLNDLGREQAKLLAGLLADTKIECIVSSDLLRAVETAEAVAERLHISIFRTPHLREFDAGKAEGLTVAEIESKLGFKKLPEMDDDDFSQTLPFVETVAAVHERASSALLQFLWKHKYSQIGVATHSAVIKTLLRSCVNYPGQMPKIGNCCAYRLTISSADNSLIFAGAIDQQ
ncbi:MAG: histidine phosphatase family protein [Candidatus Obscuribacterales bacterium]|nr:histidine phosphatase family protein [Candidatus Obscuribacterales bacterium]